MGHVKAESVIYYMIIGGSILIYIYLYIVKLITDNLMTGGSIKLLKPSRLVLGTKRMLAARDVKIDTSCQII